MGAADSKLRPQEGTGGITTVATRPAAASPALDPLLAELRGLKMSEPLLSPAPSTTGGQRPPPAEPPPALASVPRGPEPPAPAATRELLARYEEWQRDGVRHIAQKQAEVQGGIDGAEALALKVVQRLTHADVAFRRSAVQLEDVRALQADVTELTKELSATLERYEALCERLRSSSRSRGGEEEGSPGPSG